jgi:hypothetical protein
MRDAPSVKRLKPEIYPRCSAMRKAKGKASFCEQKEAKKLY